ERAARSEPVDQAAGAHRKQHRQQREQRHQHADGELGGAQIEGEERRRHAGADKAQMPERVERYEIDDGQRGFQTVIATPVQASAMPAIISAPGSTPNIASSSATANTGGRYI